MVHALLLLTFLGVASVVAWAGGGAERAFACSGPGPASSLPFDARVMEARIVGLDPLPYSGPAATPGPRPYRVLIEVTRAYRGVTVGERLSADLNVDAPGYPQPCPYPVFRTDSLGKWFIGSFDTDGGYPSLIFLGLDPSGAEYDRATAVAEVMTGSNPARPSLRLETEPAVCGEAARIVGTNFPPGRYVLRSGFWYSRRVADVVIVGGDRTFARTVRVAAPDCRDPNRPGFAGYFVTPVVLPPDDPTGGILAVAAAPVTGARASEHVFPDVLIATPFFCDAPIQVSGRGFEPGERLLLRVDGTSGPDTAVTADGGGEFARTMTVPPGGCVNQGYVGIRVSQAGFDLPPEDTVLTYGGAWSEPGNAPATRAPGPPNAGSGAGAAWPGGGIGILAVALLAASAALAAGGLARRR